MKYATRTGLLSLLLALAVLLTGCGQTDGQKTANEGLTWTAARQ